MDLITEVAKMIDHSLLHPTMTDDDLQSGCEIAMQYNVASVCIKPYALSLAVNALKGSDVLVGTVIGFPHGNSTIKIKTEETKLACDQGAKEIDMVINVGKALGQDWNYVQREIEEICRVTHQQGAILKVIFENDFIAERAVKIRLCEICTEVGVDFVKTSTGYGFVKGGDGKYAYRGATHDDLKLMRQHCGPGVQVKAAGGIRTLDELLAVKALGVTRVGASATAVIMDEARRRSGENVDSVMPPDTVEGY